jgi:aminopeptidase N
VPRGRLADAPRSFEKTPAMVDLYSRQLGVAYPWEKYAQICVDEYGWGGMEHTSATTLNLNTLHDERAHLDVSSENLVAHELIHQWFGNLLTCKDWGELWLNESFATYFATLWTEHDRGWDEAAWQRRGEADSYMREDARYRRPIVSYRYNAPMNMFDRHSYPKGGRVLHMLRFELGDEMFWKAIRRYVEVNQQRSVETADLRIAIEEATGQGMNWFFDQWCYRGGHPEFHVAWDWDSAAGQARVTVKQTQRVDDTTPLFRTSAEIEIATPAGVQMRRVTLSKAEETLHFDAAERPTRVVFDPRDWILKKLTFPKSKEELLDQLAHDEHMPARLQAVEGLAERVADADVIRALATALQSDPFFGVRQEAAKALGKANGNAVRTALSEAAARDARSFVRREALAALANHADDEARAAARASIAKDDSYYAVAEALKCLVKIDRDGCRDDLLAALAQPSHDEVILRAACDGLVELKDSAAADAVAQLLGEGASPQRRGILIATLARLRPDDDAVLDRLHALLDNARPHVRRAAIEAVGQIGTADSLDKLLARREREELPGLINTLDEALDKVRGRMQQPEALRKEVEQLRQQNQRLEERLRKLEGERS